MARLRYEAGMATNLGVLAAALAYTQAQTAYQQAWCQHELAVAGFLYACGQGSNALLPGSSEGTTRG